MRSSIPTIVPVNFDEDNEAKVSQSLLNEVKYSNPEGVILTSEELKDCRNPF